jgi:outer membrane translocation and assembly module TamA
MYSRVFDPSVTKEVRLYGLGDADFFEIEKNTTSPIKIRIIGGGGVDTFNINGKVKTMLYDLKISTTDTLNFFIKNKGNAKLRFSNETPLNERSLLEFNYNTLHFPRIEVGYNTDDGLLLGAGISKRTYGFRNLPYATNQNLSFLYAPSSAAFKISYTGEYNHITRKIDLLVNTSFAAPMIRNFFGYGNNTKIDNTKPDKYYQVRYQFLNLEALFRKRFFDNLHLMAGPVYQYYKANFTDNTTNILGKPFINGIDSAEIFTNKNYLGGKLIFLLNNTNNELFPTRGIKWVNQFVTLQGLQGSSKDFTALSSDMTIYGSMKYPARFVFILRAGGGKIYSKNYEFFQAMNFGSNNDMTGFRKNRYAGKSSLYGGLEFRYKLADVNSYILPGSLGLTGFFNTGRVWASQDLSDKWHIAYGGGIYYMPYNRLLISFSSGFSDNEKVLNFSLGTRFNLVY